MNTKKIYKKTKTFTFMTQIGEKYAKIDYIFVNKNYRGKNIARQLVNDFINKCKKLKVSSIKIDAYFETLGFWEKWFTINPKPQVINGYKQDYHDGILFLNN